MHHRHLLTALLLCTALRATAAAVPLFDGSTLAGWEGDAATWRVRDGAIVGGSLEGNPRNQFLATTRPYRNFVLRLEYRLVGSEGFVNGGVQIRSRRIAQPANEMLGYQADIGAGYTGCLYDESRRKTVLAAADKALVAKLEKPGEWNRYEVRCEGPRVRLVLNGTTTVDYVERAPGIEQDGLIALQIHGDCKAEISFRAIAIETLPDDSVPGQEEILERFADPAAAPGAALGAGWTDGAFALGERETVVVVGQTNAVRDQQEGALEALLATVYAAQRPRFRSMAWEGDTVHEQWRDLNFGSWQDQLAAVGASVVVVQFGQVEAFDGVERLGAFVSAYHRLLDQFSAQTRRLVLIAPLPFESTGSAHGPDLARRNGDIRAYADAVREIARQRQAVFVDLPALVAARPAGSPHLTDNGLHLHAAGLDTVARLVVGQLTGRPAPAALSADRAAELRAAIREKNRLFFDCWRPANWSFVYGDRVTQLFAKPSGDQPSLRQAFEDHKPLIAALDARIHALALGEPAPAAPPAAPSATGGAAPPAVLSPEAELASFTVADGYQVNLFASERDGVAKPTQIAWDERGRLFVACSPTYPHTLPGVKPSDHILVCEDTDGDGRADRSWKYAEGLTMVQGLAPGDGGLYVCDFDRLLHLSDSDGDGRADRQRVLFSGFGIGDTHQLVNSIGHGPDGSLWFSQGLHAFSRVETAWGLARLHKSGIWRLRPRSLRLEGFFNGAKAGHNCWGVAFDDFGQPFHKSGDRPHGYYSLPGLVGFATPAEYHPTGALFGYDAKSTALEFIGSSALPDAAQGCAVTAGFFVSTLDLHRLRDDGSGFASEKGTRILQTRETAFRPVDVSVGPDGALYVADWFNPVIGHYQASYVDPRRDRSHGRIWRVTGTGRPLVKPPELAGMDPAALLGQLRSPERWTRLTAKRLLGDGASDAVLAATDAWVAGLDPADPAGDRLRMEALGVYEAHESPRPRLLAAVLAASDPRLRAYATRVAGAWADRLPDPLAALRVSIRDPHPRVRLEAIVASARVAQPASIEVAVQALAAPRDRFIDYALNLAARSLEPLWAADMAAGRLAFGGDPAQAAYVRQVAGAAPVEVHPGKVVYDALCLNCHQPDGKGLAGIYPPLAGSEWVSGGSRPLIRILLHGLSGPISVAGQEYGAQNPLPMPPMGLSDQQAADVLTWVRASFAEGAGPVTADEVKAERAASAGRSTFWTADTIGR